MLYKHFTEKILGLQDILIEDIKNTDNTIHVYCKLERKLHKCPCCGNFTDLVLSIIGALEKFYIFRL
ncbi:hypothetical protein SAMN02910441_01645 [Ruminococcus sp. YE282]|jgi:transposase|nr:hypothetical protein SAMN02910441_01645 [Ruminococcus bromii]